MEFYNDMLNKIFDSINTKYIIWKREGDKSIKYIYTNKHIVKNNLEDYLEDNVEMRPYYKRILKENNIYFTIDGMNYGLISIDENIFYEVEYMNSNNQKYILMAISHKLRNPLTNIIGVLNFLNSDMLTKAQRNYIEIIQKSSYDIMSITNDIIDLINFENNNIKLYENVIHIYTFIEEIENICEKYVNGKKFDVKIYFKIKKDIPKYIVGDDARIKQILINLIKNSIDNTDIGSVVIDLSVDEESESKNGECKLLFKVKDTGKGIDKEQQKILKNTLEFKQNFKCKSYKLVGFGLRISNQLCNLMGGKIWFKSELSIGTAFFFNIVVKTHNK